jgi:hypothetical protein
MIHDKNFLKFLEAKRRIRRKRTQIIKNLFTIEKKYTLRNAFIKIYNSAKENAKKQHTRWNDFSLEYKNTTGEKPPFMLKNWFYEPDYI